MGKVYLNPHLDNLYFKCKKDFRSDRYFGSDLIFQDNFDLQIFSDLMVSDSDQIRISE